MCVVLRAFFDSLSLLLVPSARLLRHVHAIQPISFLIFSCFFFSKTDITLKQMRPAATLVVIYRTIGVLAYFSLFTSQGFDFTRTFDLRILNLLSDLIDL